MEPGGLQRIDIETEGSFINQPSNPPTHLSKIDPKKRWNLGSFWRIHGKALWSTCYWQAVSYTSVSELDARRGNMGGKGRGGLQLQSLWRVKREKEQRRWCCFLGQF